MKVELAAGDCYSVDMETEAAEDGQVSLGPAVIFDGAYGWHNTYRLVDLAVEHGMKLSHEAVAAVARYRTNPGGDDVETVLDLAESARAS